MSKNILLVVDSLSREKGVDKDIIFQAIEEALAAVSVKRFDEEVTIRVAIDRESGDYETFRFWTVVESDTPEEDEEEFIASKQITLPQAQEIQSDLSVGDVVEELIEPIEFGRIAAQQAKQFIVKLVREAEQEKVKNNYRDRIGELVVGVVKRATRDSIILDLGNNAEAMIPREHMIPRESVQSSDRLRGYLLAIREEKKGPQVLVSRTCSEFLIELFKIEVPEIGEEVIEVKAAARDAGSRAKIAVKTNDGRIDPIGACVGMRGSRVQAVSNELNGERIDIVLWDGNPAQFVINAMSPAEVSSIVVDEDSHSMDIAVAEDQLSQAIGRNGQNIRLASELSGWTLNVMTEGEAESKGEQEIEDICKVFVEQLDLDEDVAGLLTAAGFSTIEEVAYVPDEELLNIEEFDEEIVKVLRERARDVLLTRELGGDVKEPEADLIQLDGMTPDIALALAAQGIMTRESLADLSVDDLEHIETLSSEKAGKLIMKAREPWFADSKNETK